MDVWLCPGKRTLYTRAGVNREGFKFQIGRGQNVLHLTPLEQICPLKKLKWVFRPHRYLRPPVGL